MSRVQVGLEYNPVVSEVMPTANWIIATETLRSPLISLGTSSDRIGSPVGTHAYYLTVAKGFPRQHIAPYLSVNYSETNHAINYPFGINFALCSQWDLLAMNDGRRSHLLLTYKQKNYNISLIAVYMRHTGISIGLSF